MKGPTVICARGPMRCASAPDRDDSSTIMIVSGTSADPASSAEYPSDFCSCSTNANVVPPSPVYTASVVRFAPVNCDERKIESGSIGCATRRSIITKATRINAPTIPTLHCRSMRPYAIAARPSDAVTAPGTSGRTPRSSSSRLSGT